MIDWQAVTEIAATLAAIAALGGGASGVTSFLKGAFRLRGRQAQVLAWTVGALLSLSAAVVAGELEPDLFESWSDYAIAVIGVLAASQSTYKLVKEGQPKRHPTPR